MVMTVMSPPAVGHWAGGMAVPPPPTCHLVLRTLGRDGVASGRGPYRDQVRGQGSGVSWGNEPPAPPTMPGEARVVGSGPHCTSQPGRGGVRRGGPCTRRHHGRNAPRHASPYGNSQHHFPVLSLTERAPPERGRVSSAAARKHPTTVGRGGGVGGCTCHNAASPHDTPPLRPDDWVSLAHDTAPRACHHNRVGDVWRGEITHQHLPTLAYRNSVYRGPRACTASPPRTTESEEREHGIIPLHSAACRPACCQDADRRVPPALPS